jgi:hypothetical protein
VRLLLPEPPNWAPSFKAIRTVPQRTGRRPVQRPRPRRRHPLFRTGGRLSNVTIVGGGGAFVGATSDPQGVTRKGLGIVKTVASPS